MLVMNKECTDMWYLKTKLGTFWLVETDSDIKDRYFLGINDQELGSYNNADIAVKDVYEQTTGYLKWDCQAKIKVPESISQWNQGEPENWQA
jgi:hypothetical protein